MTWPRTAPAGAECHSHQHARGHGGGPAVQPPPGVYARLWKPPSASEARGDDVDVHEAMRQEEPIHVSSQNRVQHRGVEQIVNRRKPNMTVAENTSASCSLFRLDAGADAELPSDRDGDRDGACRPLRDDRCERRGDEQFWSRQVMPANSCTQEGCNVCKANTRLRCRHCRRGLCLSCVKSGIRCMPSGGMS